MTLVESAATVLFWGSLALIAYSYMAYPLLVGLAARFFGKTEQRLLLAEETLPHVTLLIAAYNEEEVIADRIANALESSYPAEKLEILIGSDGSSDRTNAIVESVASSNVRLLKYTDRGGKAAVLNRSTPQARGEVIVFTDANTFFEPAAISHLVTALSQPGVTVACGRLVLRDGESGGNVDGVYWRYETAIKRAEGRLGAVLGANGAIYAIRKSQIVPLPPHTITDDFVGPLLSKLQYGGNIVYVSEAVAIEETAPAIHSEFKRRIRIGAGNFQCLAHLWSLMLPRYGWTALAFFSHKLLRWCVPLLMLVAFTSNFFLLNEPYYKLLLAGQVLFYASSVVGMFVTGGGIAGKVLRITTMFTGMNLAIAVGFWRWLVGAQSGLWQRTARTKR